MVSPVAALFGFAVSPRGAGDRSASSRRFSASSAGLTRLVDTEDLRPGLAGRLAAAVVVEGRAELEGVREIAQGLARRGGHRIVRLLGKRVVGVELYLRRRAALPACLLVGNERFGARREADGEEEAVALTHADRPQICGRGAAVGKRLESGLVGRRWRRLVGCGHLVGPEQALEEADRPRLSRLPGSAGAAEVVEHGEDALPLAALMLAGIVGYSPVLRLEVRQIALHAANVRGERGALVIAAGVDLAADRARVVARAVELLALPVDRIAILGRPLGCRCRSLVDGLKLGIEPCATVLGIRLGGDENRSHGDENLDGSCEFLHFRPSRGGVRRDEENR